MGSNYYLIENVCRCCDRGDAKIHIGKSSGGWCFSLHVGSGEFDDTPRDLGAWVVRWSAGNCRIEDEYGARITFDEMIATIVNRSGKIDFRLPPPDYGSWDRFHDRNHSEPGPMGLLRHRIDGEHCIDHGAGTYDLIVGEFC